MASRRWWTTVLCVHARSLVQIFGLATTAVGVYFLLAIRHGLDLTQNSSHSLVRYLALHNGIVHIQDYYPIGLILTGSIIILISGFGIHGLLKQKVTIVIVYIISLLLSIFVNVSTAGMIFYHFNASKIEWRKNGKDLRLLIEALLGCCGYDALSQAETPDCPYRATCGDKLFGNLISAATIVSLLQFAIIVCLLVNLIWCFHIVKGMPKKI
jgi:hypothetical protein